ncbi:MAG: hypothetical protein HC836_28960 [Richelia sp. RM2_1_2]|nr:hypothetical protein [Richelia sp. SM1_7_0]NJN09969.1 hypothetical protein [Richelia sp. RM1_1_1]NJO31492.1 hypothetical protein [Richelia sp. SL_2_1]NJO62117.1 hypothetical protein [Richelia sp. RM2_1_2]
MDMKILRKFTAVFLAFSLCFTTVACGGTNQSNQDIPQARNVSQTPTNTKITDGEYPVQQASYNDADGEYTLFLLNSPKPTFKTDKLQMARLTEEQIKEGKASYLKVENGEPALYLTPDFKIEYVQNVTETKTDPQTGRQETVIVQRNNGFWAPFAGAVAGQAIGSLLFRPQYYVPPAYQPGRSVYTGFGGYGNSYDVAVDRYRQRYNEPPAAVRNRTTFRTTGNVRRTSPGSSTTRRTTPSTNTGNSRATGSGFGSSTLKQSGKSGSTRKNPSNSSFGSGTRSRSSGSRSRGSFGTRGRRR